MSMNYSGIIYELPILEMLDLKFRMVTSDSPINNICMIDLIAPNDLPMR